MLVNSDIKSKNNSYYSDFKKFDPCRNFMNTKASIRVNAKGELCLKNKKLLKKDYFESIKIPNEEAFNNINKKKYLNGLECKDIPSFFLGWGSLKNLITNFLIPEKKQISIKEKEEKEWNDLLKNQIHKRMAHDIFYLGETKLGAFSIKEAYLSKNHKYYEEGLGLWASLETWGVLGGKTTLIDIRGIKNREFQKIKEAFKKEIDHSFIKRNTTLKPIFYEIQSQLLCTGMQRSLIHLVNLQEREEALTFLIKAEDEILNEISSYVEKFNNIIHMIKKKLRGKENPSYPLIDPILKNEWFSLSFTSKKEDKKTVSYLNS